MSTQYHDSESDRKRSLMYARPYLCNGAATGKQCRHYWHTVIPLDVMNAVAVRQGETNRMCTLQPGLEIRLNAEDGGRPEMATSCNRYESSKVPYDHDAEEYQPLTPEEIEELRAGPELTTITSKKPSIKQRLAALFSKE